MSHSTLIFHYPPERNRINYLRKKKFNNVLPVPWSFKSTVSSNLLNRCQMKACSCLNDFVVENATTATMNCCKLEWLVNQWLPLYARLPGTRWAFPLSRTIFNSLFFQAPILVFRNEVRNHLNHKAVIHKAKQLGCPPMVCVAQDTCKGKPLEDPVLIRKMLELSDSKTEHLLGVLPFVPGMRVILTQNIAIELGLINGVDGIFRQLVYQADSVSTDNLSEAYPSNTQYVHRNSQVENWMQYGRTSTETRFHPVNRTNVSGRH